MCGGGRAWTWLHVTWACVYVSAGAVQIVTGLFFLVSLPAVNLVCNIWAGSWNVLAGIVSGMMACFSQPSSGRQERLLYISVSVLVANTINAVLTEWTFYQQHNIILEQEEIVAEQGGFNNIVSYARITTGIAAATVLIIAFLDTQLTFCSIDATKSIQRTKDKKLPNPHEQVSDIEYIIPRQKSSTSRPVNNTAYTQSWVFEAETTQLNNGSSPYLKIPETETVILNGTHEPTLDTKRISSGTIIIANPVVHIEEVSDESNSNSDRKLCYMKSFSRTPSPAVLSAASSQVSLDHNQQIYECLEKLTDQKVYRSRLNTALSVKDDKVSSTSPKKPDLQSPKATEQVQYASLMVELEQALSKKDKIHTIISPTQSNSNSSRQDSSKSDKDFKSSDADFSKELEAALQLIQDLESPNTIETPSETGGQRPLAVWRHSDASVSEKTLSAVGSLAELTSPIAECLPETRKPSITGKLPSIIIQSTDSQSTSGYSSPTRKNWSPNSSIDGSEVKTNFMIKNTNSSAVISLFTPEHHKSNHINTLPNKSITVIKLNDDDNNNIHNFDDHLKFVKPNVLVRRCSSSGSTLSQWNVKSLLRKKKTIPKLSPELESAIIKSESLAHLTESELLERCERNREIQRRIEQRVQQQFGQMTESNC